jgi:hypothetical protein
MRGARGWVVVAGLSALLLLAGCAEQTEPDATEEPFARASAALRAYAAEDARVAAAISSLPTGTVEPEQARDVLDELEAARLTTWYQAELLEEAQTALQEVLALEETTERQDRYARLQLDAAAALDDLREAQEAYVSALEELYGELALDDPDEAAVEGLAAEAQALVQGLASAEASYAAMATEAQRYAEGSTGE